jgi:hypothetical protein
VDCKIYHSLKKDDEAWGYRFVAIRNVLMWDLSGFGKEGVEVDAGGVAVVVVLH